MSKRPILYVVIALSAGIIVASLQQVNIIYPIISGISLAIAAIIYYQDKRIAHLALYLAVASLGAAIYYNALSIERNFLSLAGDGQRVFLKGVIADDPVTGRTLYGKDRTRFTLRVDSVASSAGWQRSASAVRIDLYGPRGKGLRYGDEIVLEGEISTREGLKNPGLFDYSRYLRINGIAATCRVREGFAVDPSGVNLANPLIKTAYAMKHSICEKVDAFFDKTYADFLKAILIGERSDLSVEIKDEFVKTGTVHILPCQYTKMPSIAL